MLPFTLSVTFNAVTKNLAETRRGNTTTVWRAQGN